MAPENMGLIHYMQISDCGRWVLPQWKDNTMTCAIFYVSLTLDSLPSPSSILSVGSVPQPYSLDRLLATLSMR